MARFNRVLTAPPNPVRFTRGLRFRLAFSFAILFSVLLVGLGLLFRNILINILEDRVASLLIDEWGAAKGYLRFENQYPVWYADPLDPEEALIVSRLKHVVLITDAKGNVLNVSPTYQSIGIDSPAEIAAALKIKEPTMRVRTASDGTPYLIRAGAVPGETAGRWYFIAIGRSLEDTRRNERDFTRNYFVVLPFLILFCSLLGWLLAGRALAPLNSVSHAAQRITSSNLTLQIPMRGAGDELDHLIEAFNSMMERLHLSFEQIRQFSTDVSHELRTPLTAIRGQLEVALFTAQTPDQYRDAMVNALQDVEQLSSIVRALLMLSQAESGQLALQMGPVDLREAATEFVEQYQIPAEDERVTLTMTPGPPCMVKGDRTQIERLISNLVSNAVKYTPAGGKVTVSVDAATQPGKAMLTVEDTGIGIPEDQLPHIFDRFYRVRSNRSSKVQGLGLGLSFVAWIVKVHQGSIDVDSTPGKGSRFLVTLPLWVESEGNPAVQEPDSEAKLKG